MKSFHNCFSSVSVPQKMLPFVFQRRGLTIVHLRPQGSVHCFMLMSLSRVTWLSSSGPASHSGSSPAHHCEGLSIFVNMDRSFLPGAMCSLEGVSPVPVRCAASDTRPPRHLVTCATGVNSSRSCITLCALPRPLRGTCARGRKGCSLPGFLSGRLLVPSFKSRGLPPHAISERNPFSQSGA
jgi:hypothetical protein